MVKFLYCNWQIANGTARRKPKLTDRQTIESAWHSRRTTDRESISSWRACHSSCLIILLIGDQADDLWQAYLAAIARIGGRLWCTLRIPYDTAEISEIAVRCPRLFSRPAMALRALLFARRVSSPVDANAQLSIPEYPLSPVVIAMRCLWHCRISERPNHAFNDKELFFCCCSFLLIFVQLHAYLIRMFSVLKNDAF